MRKPLRSNAEPPLRRTRSCRSTVPPSAKANCFPAPTPHARAFRRATCRRLAWAASGEDFVDRLQIALFDWIESNAPLHGRLYVMAEARSHLPGQHDCEAQKAPPSPESSAEPRQRGRVRGAGLPGRPRGERRDLSFRRKPRPGRLEPHEATLTAHGCAWHHRGRPGNSGCERGERRPIRQAQGRRVPLRQRGCGKCDKAEHATVLESSSRESSDARTGRRDGAAGPAGP